MEEHHESIRSIDFDWRNPNSCSKLSSAVRSMSVRMVKKIIRKGCSLDAPDNRGWTPLHEASISDEFFEIAQLIISAGAYVDHKTVEGDTPLITACKHEAEKIVKLLLDSDCEVNVQNNECLSPLHIACSQRNQNIIRLLIEAGADLDSKDDEERTPIYLALENVNTVALNTLIEAGADMKTKDFFSRTPLQYACMIGNLDIFNILIELLGRDKSVIDQQTPEGWTLLMEAVQYKNYLIAEKLIEYGTDTTLVDNRNLLAMHIAAHCERFNLIELLLKHTPTEAIEKYSTFGANMTHYRSLPCLIIDKDVFEGLELLFQSGLSEDVLKCPAQMGDRLVSPISFLLLHANTLDSENKIKFLEFLLSYDFLIEPEYNIEEFYNYEIKIVRPIEAAVTMHRPSHKDCYCEKFLSMILAKGISPDRNPRGSRNFLFQKAMRYGFTSGLDLLLRYSEFVEPGDILHLFLKEICLPSYLWTGQEMTVVSYLSDKCIPELSDATSYIAAAVASASYEWDRRRYNALLPIYQFLKESINAPSLKDLCRAKIRRYAHEESLSSKIPFKLFLKNIDLPSTLTKYLLYETGF